MKKFKREDFKYTTKFDVLRANINFKTYADYADKNLVSKASIDNLKDILPAGDIIAENPDLLYTSFNAAVVNLINANDDGIMTDEALAITKFFKDKHMNIEHMRSYVVGHIINTAFSTFGENMIISEEELRGSKEPFNMSLAAVVYRVIDEYFCDFLDDGGAKEISASWELAFDDYILALGSKRLADAELITDEKQIKELKHNLRMLGGSGFLPDGTPVYRVVVGDVLPLGCAFTMNPAAAVEGVVLAAKNGASNEEVLAKIDDLKNYFVSSSSEEEIKSKKKCKSKCEDDEMHDEEEMDDEEEEIAVKDPVLKKVDDKKPKNKKNNSQSNKNPVKKYKIMKIDKVEDIQQDQWEEIEASEIRTFIYDELKKADDAFKVEKEAAEAKRAEIEAAKIEAEAKAKETAEKLEEVSKKLEELEAQAAATAKQQAFDDRMTALTEEYDLDDERQKVVAKQIGDLDEESFSEWKEQFELLAVSMKKKEETTASVNTNESAEEQATKQLETAVASSEEVPNASNTEEEDSGAKLREAFSLGKGVVINK